MIAIFICIHNPSFHWFFTQRIFFQPFLVREKWPSRVHIPVDIKKLTQSVWILCWAWQAEWKDEWRVTHSRIPLADDHSSSYILSFSSFSYSLSILAIQYSLSMHFYCHFNSHSSTSPPPPPPSPSPPHNVTHHSSYTNIYWQPCKTYTFACSVQRPFPFDWERWYRTLLLGFRFEMVNCEHSSDSCISFDRLIFTYERKKKTSL